MGRPAVSKQVERVHISTPCPSPSRRASCRSDRPAYASPPTAGGHIIRQKRRSAAPLTGPTATLDSRQQDSAAADRLRGVHHAGEAGRVCRADRYGRLCGNSRTGVTATHDGEQASSRGRRGGSAATGACRAGGSSTPVGEPPT